MTGKVIPLPTPAAKPAPARKFPFTATAIKKAVAEVGDEKGVTLRDSVCSGLTLRKAARAWSFTFERKVRGVVRREVIAAYDATTVNVALMREKAQELTVGFLHGEHVPARQKRAELAENDKLGAMTLDQAIDMHAKINPHLREKTVASYRYGAGLITQGKALRMSDLTPDVVRTAYHRLVESHSPATAAQALRSVKAVWQTWAGEHPEDRAPTRNPVVAAVSAKRRGQMVKVVPRENALEPHERAPWFDAVIAHMHGAGPTGGAYAVAAALFLTGCRLREVADLTWTEVGADSFTVPAHRMKGGVALTKPITERLRAIFDHQRCLHPDSAYVFPSFRGDGPVVDPRKAMWTCCDEVLDEGRRVGPHDLRRTFVATATVAGVPEVVIKLLVGHAVADITSNYALSLKGQLPQFAAKVEAELLRGVTA